MRFSLLMAATLLCSACAKPAWVRLPNVAAPDFSSWFSNENAVPVEEVARASQCGTSGPEPSLQLFRSLAGLQAWTSSRGIDLVSTRASALPESPYAVFELGARPSGGYGVAVSAQGGLRNDTLVLKATVFEPRKGGEWASNEPSSPCVMVSLPARSYEEVKLIDQSGLVQAQASGQGS